MRCRNSATTDRAKTTTLQQAFAWFCRQAAQQIPFISHGVCYVRAHAAKCMRVVAPAGAARVRSEGGCARAFLKQGGCTQESAPPLRQPWVFSEHNAIKPHRMKPGVNLPGPCGAPQLPLPAAHPTHVRGKDHALAPLPKCAVGYNKGRKEGGSDSPAHGLYDIGGTRPHGRPVTHQWGPHPSAIDASAPAGIAY